MRVAAETLRDGIAAVYAREFERARALLEPAAAAAPDSPTVWFWLAVASSSASGAVRCLQRVLELDPAHGAAREALGKLLVAQALSLAGDDRDGACALLTQAAQVSPQLESVWTALARVSTDPEQRVEALRRAVSVAPHRAELRAHLHEAVLHQAVLCARGGKQVEARALFREAANLNPEDARVWQALARLADNPEDAVTAWRQLLRVSPNHPGGREALKKALSASAYALGVAGRRPEAYRRWREALAFDDRDPEAWLGVASASHDDREILQLVETAARLDPAHKRAAAWLTRLRARVAQPVAAASARNTAKRTVMVVDDSATIRKILGMTLERAGYSVVAEPDGERAIERLSQLVPDLILLDITMPKLDGYEVCKRIKKDPRISHVPVVMLSGKDGFFDKVKGRMVGATEYLTKPFQAPAVLAVIASHCAGGPEVAHG
ncbi:MAG TPA: response regulator [Vicinamibacterales bacterium]|nr:response regulator [Vicinamibacterales bacterium]